MVVYHHTSGRINTSLSRVISNGVHHGDKVAVRVPPLISIVYVREINAITIELHYKNNVTLLLSRTSRQEVHCIVPSRPQGVRATPTSRSVYYWDRQWSRPWVRGGVPPDDWCTDNDLRIAMGVTKSSSHSPQVIRLMTGFSSLIFHFLFLSEVLAGEGGDGLLLVQTVLEHWVPHSVEKHRRQYNYPHLRFEKFLSTRKLNSAILRCFPPINEVAWPDVGWAPFI